MSIQPITEDNFEFFTIETHPSRSYSSRLRRGSNGEVLYFTGSNGNLEEILDNTGSVKVYAEQSPIEKEAFPLQTSNFTAFTDNSLETLRREIVLNSSTNKESLLTTYLSVVNETTTSLRKQAKQEIIRFEPTVNFTSNTLRKQIILDQLMPYYRTSYISANFNFTNYNSFNFFSDLPLVTSSLNVPSESVLLYPNVQGAQITSGVFSSYYGFKAGAPFSFDFWINPKYTVDEGEEYNPGTILHLTGAYALSLHTGSYRDHNGKPKKFKLMLQVGSGSHIPPNVATASTDVFVSDDNVLNYNQWQHVTVRYGGSSYNNGSGSFHVDKEIVGNFSFSSRSLGIYNSSNGLLPYVLCVGNFYEGDAETLSRFFNLNSSKRDGLVQLSSHGSDPQDDKFKFSHPLNAEIHDLKIYNKYLTLTEITSLQTDAPTKLDNLKFYLPPFFTEESPFRKFVGTHGGILVTPFQQIDGTTKEPFNKDFAFGVDGHYINLENYVRDFANGTYPRLWKLTGSAVEPPSSVVNTADYFLYSSGTHVGANKRRLYSIMPCDHGNWQPGFNLLKGLSGSQTGGRYSNDLGNLDIGNISLRNIVTGSVLGHASTISGAVVDDILGAGPEPAKLIETSNDDNLTIYNRTKGDGDSNQIVVFDISNLFYGLRVKPGSIVLSDPNISGSDKKFGVRLKDDGNGNIYRADSITTSESPYATWASVGNVFYDEGIILIKMPQLFFFGKQGFDIEFKGIQNIHTAIFNCYARPMQLISSSNTSWSPTLKLDEDLTNEPDQRFVYITGVNIHDENMNVIMKAKTAQPIPKKSGDKLLFKIKMDY